MSKRDKVRMAICCAASLLHGSCGPVARAPETTGGSAGEISRDGGGAGDSAFGGAGDAGDSQAGVAAMLENAGQAGGQAGSPPQGDGRSSVGGNAAAGGAACAATPCQSVCQPGDYVTAAATQTQDVQCSACAPGTYSRQANAPSCTEWRRCRWKEVEQTGGTPASDRVCTVGSVFRQFGTSGVDVAYSVAVDVGGNVLVAGSTSGSLEGTSAGDDDAFVRKFDFAGNVLWTRQFGTDGGDVATSVATDLAGSIYVAGATWGSLQDANAGSRDCFVRKLDPAGNVLWTRQFGTSRDDLAYSVAVDPAGNPYAAGYTGTLPSSSGGTTDAFVRKFDNAGNVLWDLPFGTGGDELAHSIAVDAGGDVYVAGRTNGSLDGANAGAYDAFVRKLDSAGNVLWTDQFGTARDDDVYSVAVDLAGHVYLGGVTTGSLQAALQGDMDAFVRKLNSAGAIEWTRQFGTSDTDIGLALAVDLTGNVFSGGYTTGSLEGINAGAVDGFVREFDTAGAVLRSYQFGSAENELANGLAADSAGNVYVAGITSGSLQGTNAGLVDALVLQLVP